MLTPNKSRPADSMSTSSQKALEEIGNSLQKQYERWQPRARYKQLLDPTTEEVRKLCMALRKNAKVSGWAGGPCAVWRCEYAQREFMLV